MLRIKQILLASWILIAAGCSKAPLPTEPVTPGVIGVEEQSKLVITAIQKDGATVDSAEVYYNGAFIGFTPLEHFPEKNRIGSIRLQKHTFEIYMKAIEIGQSGTIFIEALMLKLPKDCGQLLVAADEDSCQFEITDAIGNIYYNQSGHEFAVTLPIAGYFIKAQKDGFATLTRAIEVASDSITIVNLQMIPLSEEILPEIQLFVAESAIVNMPVLIQWETRNATRVDIDYIDNPGRSGKREIMFTTPGVRIITATAYNQTHSVSYQDTVVVFEEQHQAVPPNLEVNLRPETAEVGEPIFLHWKTDGEYVIIDQGVGVRGVEGREEVAFNSPGIKVFTLIAYGADGLKTIVRDSVKITAAEPPLLPKIVLEVTEKVLVDEPVEIAWQAENASFVDIDFIGQQGTSGKTEITFHTPGIRIITATAHNLAGQSTARDTVIVVESIESDDPIYVPCKKAVAANHKSIPLVDEQAAVVEIQHTGYYRVIADADFNTGDAQQNESFFIVIQNADGTIRHASDPNAGMYKVIADEPGPAHVSKRDAGTFYFSRGINVIQLHHYAEIARQYPRFAVNPPITGVESVKVLAFYLSRIAGYPEPAF
ncbi:hypothetical protein JXJ21_07415 [candidate division KSB1 bacterium]|nr:hypothetical protein [candidate division KSB1 bacterium]